MDIFTTQLTRVVPVPIKPANLKVKALLKDARVGKLKEDLDHLENHDYYFEDDKGEDEKLNKEHDSESKESMAQNNEQDCISTKETEGNAQEGKGLNKDTAPKNTKGITESEDGVKHLDLYV
ncbi:hypothetical protein L3081_09895 [Colwellia sp. MSW7]|jgi:hypothetical protein|uniref:Uncharacterized protein n=1 Tax=Colwellia maritima TaxID=2912588 RepID=A0ABS9X0F8_9GAMM|nr:hypothetical protein [Colwellia maritima]MCI2283644.1 hypothetical protein [Colwellia maritima]